MNLSLLSNRTEEVCTLFLYQVNLHSLNINPVEMIFMVVQTDELFTKDAKSELNYWQP